MLCYIHQVVDYFMYLPFGPQQNSGRMENGHTGRAPLHHHRPRLPWEYDTVGIILHREEWHICDKESQKQISEISKHTNYKQL